MRSNITLLSLALTTTLGCANVLGFDEGILVPDASLSGGANTSSGGTRHSGGTSNNKGGTATSGGAGVAGNGLGGTVSAGGSGATIATAGGTSGTVGGTLTATGGTSSPISGAPSTGGYSSASIGGAPNGGVMTNVGGARSTGGNSPIGSTATTGGTPGFGGATNTGGTKNLTGGNPNSVGGTFAATGGAVSSAGGTVNSGGGTLSAGASASGGCATTDPLLPTCAAVTATGTNRLIDDFTDGDAYIAINDGRNGVWYTFNDGTGVQTPEAPVTSCTLPLPTAGKMCTSGSGFSSWGAGIGVNLNAPSTCLPGLYNASSYLGISFTISGTITSGHLRFVVETSATTEIQFGGTCTSVETCGDHFGVNIVPSSTAQQVTLPFTSLRQGGYGTPANWTSSAIIGLQWQINRNYDALGPVGTADFSDLCIDDIAFY